DYKVTGVQTCALPICANGAGKTTTLKIIMNLIFADEGLVKIFGRDHSELELKKKIGFLTERPYFYDYLTGREFQNFCADLFGDRSEERRVGKECRYQV